MPRVQFVERQGHDDHDQGAGDDRLGTEDPDDQPEVAIAQDRPEAGACMTEEGLPLRGLPVLRDRVSRGLESDDECRRPQEGERIEDVDGLDVRDGEEHTPECRSGEEPDALDDAGRDVRSGEFTRISGERG